MRVIGRSEFIQPYQDRNPQSLEARDLKEWYWFVCNINWLGEDDLVESWKTAIKVGPNRWDYPMPRAPLTVETFTEIGSRAHPDGLVEIIGVR